MTAMEFLTQVQDIREYIDSRTCEMECWRSMARSIPASNFEPHYNATRNTSAVYVSAIEKADEIQRDIDTKYATMIEKCNEINAVIDLLSDVDEKILLRYRYIEHRSWADIGTIMSVSYSTIKRIHKSAINKISDILK